MVSTDTTQKTVLLVEDDPGIAELERRTLARIGFTVRIATTVRDALALLQTESFLVILLDYQLPDGDPWTIVAAAEAMNPSVPVILVTAMGNERVAAEAIHRGVAEYLKKTDSFLDLLPAAIERVTRLAATEAALKRSGALLQLIAHNTTDVIMITSPHGIVKYVSPACQAVYGREAEALLGRSSFELIHPEDRERITTLVADLQPQQRITTTFRGLRHDNREVWIESSISALSDSVTGRVSEIVRVSRDISARMQNEQALREQEIRYRTLFENSPTALWEMDFSAVRSYLDELANTGIDDLSAYLRSHPQVLHAAAGKIQFLTVNAATLRLYEAASIADLRTGLHRPLSDDALKMFQEELCALLSGAQRFNMETHTRSVNGRDIVVSVHMFLLPGSEASWERVVVSMFDITAHREAEHRLRNSLREKEVLLKEIHHRVKNNLQVISSLLNLQALHVKQQEAKELLAECRSRVESIAMIHENLYQSPDLAQVNFDEYVRSLVGNLFHSYSAAARGITANIDMGGVQLPVDTAIPCGLVINELITNALKHAFTGRDGGLVQVGMRRIDDGRLELYVQDNGIGLPADLDPHQVTSLGLDLVCTFAEQLEAELQVLRNDGAGFVLRFLDTH